MSGLGKDLWADAPKLPIRYLVRLVGASETTLARSRPNGKPIDVAAALRGDLGPVVEFMDAAEKVSAIDSIERVDEEEFQAFCESREDGDDLAGRTTPELFELKETLEKIPQNASRERSPDENVLLTRVCLMIRRRQAEGTT